MFDNLPERKGKTPVSKNPKIIEKIIPSAIKYKEILSAGKYAMVNILGIEGGQNLDGKITRDEFEAASADELSRVYKPIEKILQSANMTLDDISWVEIIGGSVRVPAVQNLLKEKLGSKLGVHMNGDDSVAFGAAFVAANFSSNFRLAQKIELYHGNNFEILLKIQHTLNDTEPICEDDFEDLAIECTRKLNKSALLYRVRHGYDTFKTVSLKHDGDFDVLVYEKFPGEEAKLIVRHEIIGVKDVLKTLRNDGITDKPKVHLKFHLNRKGLVSLSVIFQILILLVRTYLRSNIIFQPLDIIFRKG